MTSPKPVLSNLNLVLQETVPLTWTIDAFEVNLNAKKISPPSSSNQFQIGLYPYRSAEISAFYFLYKGHKKKHFFDTVFQYSMLMERNVTLEYDWHYLGSNHAQNHTYYEGREKCNKLLVNGSLKLYCEVDILAQSAVTVKFQFESFDELAQNYATLLASGKWTDFVVVIGDRKFKVHKMVLATRSPVFAAMFEHDTQEMKEGRVVIEDVEAEVFELLVRYIYTGKVEEMGEHVAELLVAADKYQLNHLKSICEQSLIFSLTAESVCDALLFSDMHNAQQLKEKCTEYIERNTKEVMQTKGCKELVKSNRAYLVAKLFGKSVIKQD